MCRLEEQHAALRQIDRWVTSFLLPRNLNNRYCPSLFGNHLGGPELKLTLGNPREVHHGSISFFIAAVIAFSTVVAAPLAQAEALVGGTDAPKPSRLKMTKERIKELLAKWRENRPQLKASAPRLRKRVSMVMTAGSTCRTAWKSRDGPLGRWHIDSRRAALSLLSNRNVRRLLNVMVCSPY